MNAYKAADNAASSLAFWAEQLTVAAGGAKPHISNDELRRGPFATALHTLATISDTGIVADQEQARKDMLYVLEYIDYVGGYPRMAIQPHLDSAMERIGDLVSANEAAALLGEPAYMVDAYARSQTLHPLRKDGADLFALYEVKAYKARQATRAQVIAEARAKHGEANGE